MRVFKPVDSNRPISLEDIEDVQANIKILIVHTPLLQGLQVLSHFNQLVKLDLSDNNLTSFPYLGHLKIRFLFIHQNRLKLSNLIGIFQQKGQQSDLSKSVCWVTFWGNQQKALYRHYIVNCTSAMACDQFLISDEELSVNLQQFPVELRMFSQLSDISGLLKQVVTEQGENVSSVRQLWKDIGELRKRYQDMHPVIKIQRIWRGFIVRKKINNFKDQESHKAKIRALVFFEWKKYTSIQLKLKKLLVKYKIRLSFKPTKSDIRKKMIELARHAKAKVLHRKEGNEKQYKFYLALKLNLQLMQDFYSFLQIQQSNALFVCIQNWNLVEKFIVPFVKFYSETPIIPLKNISYFPNYIYSVKHSKSKQMIKMIQLNTFSIFKKNNSNKDPRERKKYEIFRYIKKSTLGCHLNLWERAKLIGVYDELLVKDKIRLNQLIMIKGDLQFLKDVTRGMFFFNTGRFEGSKGMKERINFFSSRCLAKMSSITMIQACWKGYIYRKKNLTRLKQQLKRNRAARKIQKWARGVSARHRKYFSHLCLTEIKDFKGKSFVISFEDYFNLLNEPTVTIFPEQKLNINLDKFSLKLAINWKIIEGRAKKKKKLPFCQLFLKKLFEINEEDNFLKRFNVGSSSLIKKEKGFLFHYQTDVKILNYQKKTFLEIEFSDNREAKLRWFILSLLAYRIKGKKLFCVVDSKKFHKKIVCFQHSRIPYEEQIFVYDKAEEMKIKRSMPIQKVVHYSEHEIGIRNYVFDEEKTETVKFEITFLISIFRYSTEVIESKDKMQQKIRKQQKQKSQNKEYSDVIEHLSTRVAKHESLAFLNKGYIQTGRKRSIQRTFKRQKQKKQKQPNFLLCSNMLLKPQRQIRDLKKSTNIKISTPTKRQLSTSRQFMRTRVKTQLKKPNKSQQNVSSFNFSEKQREKLKQQSSRYLNESMTSLSRNELNLSAQQLKISSHLRSTVKSVFQKQKLINGRGREVKRRYIPQRSQLISLRGKSKEQY